MSQFIMDVRRVPPTKWYLKSALTGKLTVQGDLTKLLELLIALRSCSVRLVSWSTTPPIEPGLRTVTRASWDAHIAVNLRAPVVLMQSFAAALPQDHDGVIVNMLDQRVRAPTEDFLSYTMTRNALWGLTRSLALDLAPRIRINGVGPGPTLGSIHQSTDVFERQAASVPLQHASVPEDVAAAVVYLASARSVTGQMIAVDGGQHLWWAPPGPDTPTDT